MDQRAAVTFRAAGPEDGPFLVDLLVAAVNWHPERHLPRGVILADPALRHYVADWPRPDDGGIVALVGSHRVGAAWWRLFSATDPGYGFVATGTPELSMAVLAGWRGRGVGRLLLRAVKDAAAAHCGQLSLSVERANPARRLYVSEGFRVVGGVQDSDTMLCDLGTTTTHPG